MTKLPSKSPFSEYLGFQRNALEFSKCHMPVLERTCGTIWWKKKLGDWVKKQTSKEGFEKTLRMSMPAVMTEFS